MSGKIKAKDLSYDSTLPPFLQRLHDKNAGRGDTDRHERALARPRKEKDPNDDDEPTVIDESGETLTKGELAKLTDVEPAGDAGGSVTGEVDDDAAPKASGALPDAEHAGKRAEQRVTDGAASKKRKAAKVVGDEDPNAEKPEAANNNEKKAAKKPKKKAKPIKLAFDDGEG
ncbi:hypothetical protein LTR85_004403 [Meristemomyces frigidus]|nr:hypothetical protein LTR85_004403 [Meristemomyces frigidus]